MSDPTMKLTFIVNVNGTKVPLNAIVESVNEDGTVNLLVDLIKRRGEKFRVSNARLSADNGEYPQNDILEKFANPLEDESSPQAPAQAA